MKNKILIPAIVAVALAGMTAALVLNGKKTTVKETTYKTSIIARGDVEESVSSTGNLEAVGTVDVLTQVTGVLEKIYVDFNDKVQKGQPLAEINTDKLKMTLREAKAALDKAAAQYEYDKLEYDKSAALHEKTLISDSDLAAKKLSYLTSKAAMEQAEATYDEARIDIEKYAVILSPISGIVLDRAVEAGDTVVGSGSTNTQLFTLAENLDAMEIKASVDELDISKVKVGQAARFTVEAYTDKTFDGEVRQIRVVPTEEDNVVSYTVIVRTDNAGGYLLPGMTATVEFLVTAKKDIVLVPSTAFRFTPSDEVQAAAKRRAFEARIADKSEKERSEALKQYDKMMSNGDGQRPASILGGAMGRMPGAGGPPPGAGGPPGSGSSQKKVPSESTKTIWLLEQDGSVSMRMVTIGATDGVSTEILDGDDLIGAAVITRAQ